MNETIDVTAEPSQPTLALAKVEPQQIQKTEAPALTPAQARVESVADVLAKARANASMLQLNPEEIKLLKAEFPDEAFKMGAGGDPNLIYIEHAFLRDRFDEALGMGQWALVRSRPHWAEEFETNDRKKAVRLYADCALLIRGCLVSEAIGDMVYYPHNAKTNYGDAAEGSETAAFRRCAKKIGVGLQAWKKDFGEGWKQRQRTPRPAAAAPLPQQDDRAPVPVFGEKEHNKFRSEAEAWLTKERDAWCKAHGDEHSWVWAVSNGLILQTESIGAITWSQLWVGVHEHIDAAIKRIKTGQSEAGAKRDLNVKLLERKEAINKQASACGVGDAEMEAFIAVHGPPGLGEPEDSGPPPNLTDIQNYPGIDEPPAPNEPGITSGGRPCDAPDAPWRSFPVPFGTSAGVPLAALDKKKLFGFWANFEVETTYEGKPRSKEKIARDKEFRAALDEAGRHYNFTEPKAK